MPGIPARARFAIACLLLLVFSCPSMAAAPTDEKLTVLSYHEIADPGEALIPDYAVTPTNFVRQIDWLRNNGYNFVSVDEVLADQAGKSHLPEKAVLLTFDDGYVSMYEHAWPLLKMLRIPSVVAVVGTWEEDLTEVNFDGHKITRDKLMRGSSCASSARAGWWRSAAIAYDLHRGIPGNPQGNMEPAATTRRGCRPRASTRTRPPIGAALAGTCSAVATSS